MCIVAMVSVLLGLILSFGFQLTEWIFATAGIFERLSLFSLMFIFIIALYWLAIVVWLLWPGLYVRNNSRQRKVLKKVLFIVGLSLTLLWFILFMFSKNFATVAFTMKIWKAEHSGILSLLQNIGHLLLAFFIGIWVTNFSRRVSRRKNNIDNNKLS